MGQLYGSFDENTHEWRDGVLANMIRVCSKMNDSSLKWVLFDGPVDTLWIESMNTVLETWEFGVYSITKYCVNKFWIFADASLSIFSNTA